MGVAASPGENKMHKTPIIVSTLLVAAVIAVLSVTVINAKSKHVATVPASASMDVMQMMKDANNLPNQQFDAH
jgi:hypothetical protein